MKYGYDRFNVLARNADTEGSGGEGGSENTDTTQVEKTESEDTTGGDAGDVTKLIEKAVEAAVAGLKKKNEEIIGANKRLKGELDAQKGKPTLSDDEYTEFKTLKEKMEQDELLRLFAEGKSSEVIDRVTKKTRLDAEAKLTAEAEARARIEAEATSWKSKYEQTTINIEVTKAAAGAVKPVYQDLVTKLVADRVKLVDGAVRVVNSDGEIEMTANGAKPLTVADYIETMRTTYSDLFLAPSGGGAGGSGGKGPRSTKLSMDAAEHLSMDDYMRLRAEGKI